jgi:hypothetical protein
MAVALPVASLEMFDILGMMLIAIPIAVILGAVWDEVRRRRR